MTKPRAVAAAILAWVSAGCAPPDAPLPAIETSGFLPVVAERFATARRRASDAPDEALAVGDYCLLLHAYQYDDEAAGCYRLALAAEPPMAEWAVFLGMVELDRGDAAAAVEAFRVAVDLGETRPAVAVYHARADVAAGDNEAAETRLAAVLAAYADRADAHLELARLRQRAGDHESAVTHLEKALAEGGDFGDAHYLLARSYRSLGDGTAAEQHTRDFERFRQRRLVMEDDPRAEVSRRLITDRRHIQRAKALLAAGEFGAAATELERAHTLNPEKLSTLTNLVAAYGKAGRLDKAAEAYRRGLEIDAGYYQLHLNFGIVLAHSGRAADAERAFSAAAAADPSRPEPWIEYGMLITQAGQAEEGANRYRKALEVDPDSARAHRLLGQYLALTGEYSEAAEHLTRAVAVDPAGATGTLRMLSGVQGAMGETAQARATLGKALEMAEAAGDDAMAEQIRADIERLDGVLATAGGGA